MKIFVTGGTGFVGTRLITALIEQGHQVTVLTRQAIHDDTSDIDLVQGNPMVKGKWQQVAAEHDVIINLAGENIFGRWTQAKKEAIRDSRILSTANVVEAIARGQKKEMLLFNASAVGYYGFHGDEMLTEDSTAGVDFLGSVARQWEGEAQKAEYFGARVVLCRFGVILGKHGGALEKMLPVFSVGFGSALGSGKQWFSWIHIDDLVRIFLFLLDRPTITGPVNCTSPNPVRNSEFARSLSEILNKPYFMPNVPGFVIRTVLGQFGEILIKGQRVIPKKLLHAGFEFRFPEHKKSLESIVK
ncbi:MAG TPA: TIGR01777 family oxidoreductase [Thermodesulfovibrionia bacterium]|nr:TIGR01777 family oxidoreductase [Thermodesulfovibrionia bacterium]